MENLFLIVGLGNPGREYALTRHNAGFLVVEQLAERWTASWGVDKRFEVRLARLERSGRRVILCEPRTYMNASGRAVKAVMEYYRAALERVLVIVDDADLPLGTIRMRPEGSSGGHHGLESVETHLGTRGFARLRIGIGRSHEGQREITGRVLGRFDAAERPRLRQVLDRAASQVECWMDRGIEMAMNQFNGIVTDAGQQ